LPLGQRTSAWGVGVAEADVVGVAVGVGDESSRPLGVDVDAEVLTTCRRPPAKTVAATTVVSTTANTPMMTASRRFRDGPAGDPLSEGGVEAPLPGWGR
jgi:hypothetical protein